MYIPIDVTGSSLETERLLLRPWQWADLYDFFRYASVDGVGEMAGWKHHESLDDSRVILQRFISEKNVFALIYKEDNKAVAPWVSMSHGQKTKMRTPICA